MGRAARLDTATISDALDRHGVAGQCLGIKPLHTGFRLAGRAFTLHYAPQGQGGTVGDYIDDIEAGNVVVIDNGGRPDATVWGEILTFVAHKHGLAGTVIDGACRDVELALKLGYPVYSRSYSMRTGKDRVQLEAINRVINIGDARVAPGDLIRGDADGVIVVPKEQEDAILAAAEEIDASEQRIRDAVSSGKRLDAARREARYHSLQTRAKTSF